VYQVGNQYIVDTCALVATLTDAPLSQGQRKSTYLPRMW